MKSKRLITLLTVLVMAFAVTVFKPVTDAKAEISPTNFWSISTVESIDGGMKLTLGTGLEAEYVYKLDISKFNMNFSVSDNFTTLKIVFTSDNQSDGVNVVNTVTINNASTDFVRLNSNSTRVLSSLSNISLEIKDGTVYVNGNSLGNLYNTTNTGAKLSVIAISENGDTTLTVKEINKQGYGKNTVDNTAPVFDLSDSFYTNTDKVWGYKYSVTARAYDACSTPVTTVEYKAPGDTEYTAITSSVKFLMIGIYEIKLTATDNEGNVATEVINMTVKEKDTSTPVYNYESADYTESLDKYNEQVAANAMSKTEEGKYIALGSNCYYTVPNISKLVSDDCFGYSDFSFKVYYTTPSTTSFTSTSSMQIPVAKEGRYFFYVVITDAAGNSMDSADYDEPIAEDSELTKIPLFTFEVYNTTGPTASAASVSEEGYVGITYTTSFTVSGVDTSSEFTLLYRANSNASWETAEETYSGSTFTPTKLGEYKATVRVVDSSLYETEAETDVISVKSYPKSVNLTADWLRDNQMTLIFGGIAALCLIGIIVLLCIKPKED